MNIWDTPRNAETCGIFGKTGFLGGTIDDLLFRAVINYVDPKLIRNFVSTCPSFASSWCLVDKLAQLIHVPSSYAEEESRKIQKQVGIFTHHW